MSPHQRKTTCPQVIHGRLLLCGVGLEGTLSQYQYLHLSQQDPHVWRLMDLHVTRPAMVS